MPYQFLQVEKKDGVLVVTLDDPKTRNAIGPEMAQELRAELDRFEADSEDRVLLLTGRDPSFCSGANVRRFRQDIETQEVSREPPPKLPWGEMEARLNRRSDLGGTEGSLVPLRIHELQKPSIAAVNGHAIGLGMGIALSCDIRIASEKAAFSEAFVRMGLIPGDGSTWQLPRLIGLSHTFYLQYTGETIDGKEAHRLGLASKVVPHEELMPAALEMATRLAQGPTYAMSLIKYLVHRSLETDMREALHIAHAAQDLVRRSEDHKEAVRAFLEKRKPRFKGR